MPVVLVRIPCICTGRGVVIGLGDVVRAWALLGELGEPLDELLRHGSFDQLSRGS